MDWEDMQRICDMAQEIDRTAGLRDRALGAGQFAVALEANDRAHRHLWDYLRWLSS